MIMGYVFIEIDVNNLGYKSQKTLSPVIVQSSGVKKLLENELLVVVKGCEYTLSIANEDIEKYKKVLRETNTNFIVKSTDNTQTTISISSPKHSFYEDLLFIKNSVTSVNSTPILYLKNSKNVSNYVKNISNIVDKSELVHKCIDGSKSDKVTEICLMLRSAIIGIDMQLDRISKSIGLRYISHVDYSSLTRSSYWYSVEYSAIQEKYGAIFLELEEL